MRITCGLAQAWFSQSIKFIKLHRPAPSRRRCTPLMKPYSILIFILALFIGCTVTNSKNKNYPDCTSADIEKMDTCLLGLTIKQAIEKLGIDTSQILAFDEPPGIIRGASIQLSDTCRIRLYVTRFSIMDTSGLFYDPYRVHYREVIDKKIIGVAWRKLKDNKYVRGKSLGPVIRYWGD